jgi:hypothetical protein
VASASRSFPWLFLVLTALVAGCPSEQPPILGPADPMDAVYGPRPSAPPVAVGQNPDPVITSVPGPSPSRSAALPGASASPGAAPSPSDEEEEEEEGSAPQADLVVVQAPTAYRGKGTVTVEIHFPAAEQAKASTNDVRSVEVILNEDKLFGVETVGRGTIERGKMVAYRAAVQFTEVKGDGYKVEVIAKDLAGDRLGSAVTEVKLEDDAIARLYALMSVPPAGEVKVDLAVAPAVYVQGATTSGIHVMWESGRAVASRVAVQNAAGTTVAEHNDASTRRHQHPFTGLQPGTPYAYKAYEGDVVVGSGFFRTNRAVADSKIKFAVLGDTGRRTAEQFAIADRIKAWGPEFMLHAGDVVYPSGAAKDYGPKFVEPYQDLIRNTVMYPSLGNHDYRTDDGQPYLDFFEAPPGGGSNTERYYGFTSGNALFLCLDTNQDVGPGTPQYVWLEQQLKTTTAAWVFPFFHHPPYSSGDHGSDTDIRKALSPLFERYNVQLVFTGHDHHYERTKPQEEFVKDGMGVVYIVAGGGGADLRAVKPQAFTALAVSKHHFLGVTIDGKKLTMEALDEKGVVFDTLSLTAP